MKTMKTQSVVKYSFEFFPPKTLDSTHHLMETAKTLANLQPEFFSVTFGAGGSTRDGTIETLKLLQNKTSIPVAPHISCMGHSRETITTLLNEYKALGVKRIVTLRGDLAPGATPSGEFQYAHQLVKLIRDVTGNQFHLEVAAYPEVHPQAENAHADVINLKRKYEAGANSAITQYFFNADAYFYFLEECTKQQIRMPIVPGVMPITNFKKLLRFSQICGAEIPRWIMKRLEQYEGDDESVAKFGAEFIFHFCQQLLTGGAPGLHFYTLNHAQASMEVIHHLHLVPKKVSQHLQAIET